MRELFAKAKVLDFHERVYRNIVSLHTSKDLFADIAPSATAANVAMQVELLSKPSNYGSHQPIIDRPFEEAMWSSVVQWPFDHWRKSRFCDGSFGIWYGSKAAETTVHESIHHWHAGLLRDAGYENKSVYAERKIYAVQLDALTLDFSRLSKAYPEFVHPNDYSFCQSIGKRVSSEGLPAIAAQSARDAAGLNLVAFKPSVLSAPQLSCQVSYHLKDGSVSVEKQPGEVWLTKQL